MLRVFKCIVQDGEGLIQSTDLQETRLVLYNENYFGPALNLHLFHLGMTIQIALCVALDNVMLRGNLEI